MKIYEVGGCVRDEILGVPSKDIDFTVVLEESDFITSGSANPFSVMRQILVHKGFEIFLETPEFLTIRARFPKGWITQKADTYRGHHTTTADFVLARKESDYADGRRPDKVEPGTLEDDLRRRDFTMNAIAKDADGSYVDPHNGREDIERRVIRAVGDPYERLHEDALRAVRALRFAVTKGFKIDPELNAAMDDREICEKVKWKISDERISEEVGKMFRYSTIDSLYELSTRNRLTTAIFSGRVSLDSTMKQKGRGK